MALTSLHQQTARVGYLGQRSWNKYGKAQRAEGLGVQPPILPVVIRRPPEAGICVSKYIRPEGEGMIGAEPLGIAGLSLRQTKKCRDFSRHFEVVIRRPAGSGICAANTWKQEGRRVWGCNPQY